MRWLLQGPWGALVFSAAISSATGVAILAFGMAPKMLVVAAWGTAAVYTALNAWADRRFGRR